MFSMAGTKLLLPKSTFSQLLTAVRYIFSQLGLWSSPHWSGYPAGTTRVRPQSTHVTHTLHVRTLALLHEQLVLLCLLLRH